LDTAMGRVAMCPLEAPFEQLRFGCGRAPETEPHEHLSLRATSGGRELLYAGATELFGSCELLATGALAGWPTWSEDTGDVACFFDLEGTVSGDGRFRTVDGGHEGIAAGLYLRLPTESMMTTRALVGAARHLLASSPHTVAESAASAA